jgi:C-terminal processing protease CtpA/Prc
VQSLIAGGPAATSGEVLEGDVLMSAGGTDTSAIPLPELARLLIGPEGQSSVQSQDTVLLLDLACLP